MQIYQYSYTVSQKKNVQINATLSTQNTWRHINLLCLYRHKILARCILCRPKKSKPDNLCNDFVYCQPIFI